MMANLDVDPVAKQLGERFGDAGFELYLVGGVVRDAMLGRTSPDIDLATSAKPHETTRVLQGWADNRYHVGVRFGTVGARKDGRLFEITTFREEVYAEEHRKPAVTFAKDIETDLSRRDFTINAMAVRLPDGAFVDPFGGVKHLAAKILDTPLEPEVAFSDDPLRMLRAARFVSQLEVEPSERVVRAITEMRERLAIVSAERIRAELDKLLVGAKPSAGLALIVDTGLSDEFLPELSALQLEQDPVHQHKDVLRHTYAVVERCEPDLVLRLAGLLHDIGKPKTRAITPDGVQFHHHEIVGARMAEASAEGAALLPTRWSRRSGSWSSCTCVSTGTATAGPTAPCGATSATPGRCSTVSTSSRVPIAPPETSPVLASSNSSRTSSRSGSRVSLRRRT